MACEASRASSSAKTLANRSHRPKPAAAGSRHRSPLSGGRRGRAPRESNRATIQPIESVDPSSSSSSPRPWFLKEFELGELEDFMVDELSEDRKRARQVWTHLYGDKHLATSWEEGFSRAFLAKVEERIDLGADLEVAHAKRANDGTTKLVFQRRADGLNVETVLIPAKEVRGRKPRTTVCVSSQVGCAMGCKFCYTGLMGLQVNLTAGQIVEQVIEAKRMASITNIVFMGMGEPMHNLDAVLKAIRILTTPSKGYTHFSPRRITVSTVGLVPEIRRFTAESDCQLALSLHATTDESRSSIVPTNKKYSIQDLVDCLEYLYPKGRTKGIHGRHVLIEYVMLEVRSFPEEVAKRSCPEVKMSFEIDPAVPQIIKADYQFDRTWSIIHLSFLLTASFRLYLSSRKGVNDTAEDAERLVGLLENVECKVNLLVFNSFEGSPYVPSSIETVKSFRSAVVASGMVCTIRDSRGDDEMAACGQLGFKVESRRKK